MNVRCDICGKSYRNQAPVLVGRVTDGVLSMEAPDTEKDDYWKPGCKCPMTPRVDA